MDIEKTTDPGIIRLKLKQEIQALRDSRREDRLEFMEESQRMTREFNDLASRHNELVGKASDAVKLAATLASCLAAATTFALLLVVTAWLEGTVPLRAVVMGIMIAAGVGFVVHTLIDQAFWEKEQE